MPSSRTPRQRDRRSTAAGRWSRTWIYLAIAFGLGLLLFAVVWLKQRNDRGFYRPDASTQAASGRQFEPLPGPDMDAVGNGGRSEPAAPADAGTGSPRLVETKPVPPPPPAEPAGVPQSSQPGMPAAPVASADTAPVPIDRPAPAYPRDALRRGESGEVLLRVEVDAAGLPTSVAIVRGSGSRSLDRAAQAVVRTWRFQPAQRDGLPVTGEFQVPIAFDLRR